MLNNEACSTYFSQCPRAKFSTYRIYVIARIKTLKTLDGTRITDEEWRRAEVEDKRYYFSPYIHTHTYTHVSSLVIPLMVCRNLGCWTSQFEQVRTGRTNQHIFWQPPPRTVPLQWCEGMRYLCYNPGINTLQSPHQQMRRETSVCAHMRACVRVCVCACVRACGVCVRVWWVGGCVRARVCRPKHSISCWGGNCVHCFWTAAEVSGRIVPHKCG